jgi:hypothetical protein
MAARISALKMKVACFHVQIHTVLLAITCVNCICDLYNSIRKHSTLLSVHTDETTARRLGWNVLTRTAIDPSYMTPSWHWDKNCQWRVKISPVLNNICEILRYDFSDKRCTYFMHSKSHILYVYLAVQRTTNQFSQNENIFKSRKVFIYAKAENFL